MYLKLWKKKKKSRYSDHSDWHVPPKILSSLSLKKKSDFAHVWMLVRPKIHFNIVKKVCSPDLVGPVTLSSVKVLGSEELCSSFLMQSSAELKTHDTMFKNNASNTNTCHTAILKVWHHWPAIHNELPSRFTALDGGFCSHEGWSRWAIIIRPVCGVQHNELVLLPVADLGETDGAGRRRRSSTAAAGLCGWVGLAVWSERALGPAGVTRLNALHLRIQKRSLPVSLGSSWTEEHRWTVPLLSGLRGSSVSLGPSRGSAVWRGVLLASYYAGLRDLPEWVCGAGGVHGER